MSSIELNATIREARIWFKIFSIPLVGKLAQRARRFRDGISRTLNVGVLHLLKEQHEFPLNLYLCLNSFHA